MSALYSFSRIAVHLWVIFYLTTLDSFAQSVTNYSFSASGGTFTPLISGTTNPGTGTTDDGAWNGNPIGFDFWYMGARYSTISASTNGWLVFGSSISSYGYVNSLASTSTSNATTLRPVIAPLWDDLSIASVSGFTYQTSGTAGSRIFTAEFLNEKWQYPAGSACISFQVRLYEGTGKIEFIYRPESGALSSPTASIGITGNASGNYLSLNGTGSSPTASSTSESTSLNTKPASGQTYAFTPPVPANPTGLTFTGVTSSSVQLNWTDNASNEVGYLIYRSDDNGATYEFITQTGANVTSSVQSGLLSSHNYYWKIYAVTEGALSNSLSGSQPTGACSGAVTTRTWIGAGNGGTGTDFNAASNWSPAGVPNCADSLYMQLTANATITLSSSIEIGAINASVSGANNVFRLNTGAYTFQINHTATFNIPSGNSSTQLQVNAQNEGKIIYNKAATFSAAAGTTFPITGLGGTTGTVKFKGNVTFNNGCASNTFDQPSTVIFDASGTQTITCNNTGYYIFFGRLTTEIGDQNSPTVILSGTTYATVYGNLNINGSSALDLSTHTLNRYSAGGSLNIASGATLKLAAGSGGQTGSNFPSNFSTFALNANSTVIYNSTNGVNQTIFSVPVYGNLTLTNASASGSSTKTAGGNLTIAKNLTVSNAFTTFSGGSGLSHSVGGNWTNNGTFTYSSPNTIQFNGSASQLIGGTSTAFYNFIVNNTGLSGNDKIILNAATNVAGSLTLTDGIVVSSATYLLTMSAGSTASSGNSTGPSFVDGPMIKTGNTAFDFPVGDGTKWARIGISAPSNITDQFTAQYFDTPFSNTTSMAPSSPALDVVSAIEYWTLDRTMGSSNTTVKLYWENASVSGITDCPNLRVAHWNSSTLKWENNNDASTVSGLCSGTSSGSIVTNSPVSSYSPFTFGNIFGGQNPLPVELLDFSASCDINRIRFEWTTATETGNDYFSLEKSTDGIQYVSIGMIEGAGNSSTPKNYSYTDNDPYSGTTYYRLRQTDYNGDERYFSALPVDNCSTNETDIIDAYSDSDILTVIARSDSEQRCSLGIFDITGRKIAEQSCYLAKGNNELRIPVRAICIGVYFIRLQSDKELLSHEIIIK